MHYVNCTTFSACRHFLLQQHTPSVGGHSLWAALGRLRITMTSARNDCRITIRATCEQQARSRNGMKVTVTGSDAHLCRCWPTAWGWSGGPGTRAGSWQPPKARWPRRSDRAAPCMSSVHEFKAKICPLTTHARLGARRATCSMHGQSPRTKSCFRILATNRAARQWSGRLSRLCEGAQHRNGMCTLLAVNSHISIVFGMGAGQLTGGTRATS